MQIVCAIFSLKTWGLWDGSAGDGSAADGSAGKAVAVHFWPSLFGPGTHKGWGKELTPEMPCLPHACQGIYTPCVLARTHTPNKEMLADRNLKHRSG